MVPAALRVVSRRGDVAAGAHLGADARAIRQPVEQVQIDRVALIEPPPGGFVAGRVRVVAPRERVRQPSRHAARALSLDEQLDTPRVAFHGLPVLRRRRTADDSPVDEPRLRRGTPEEAVLLAIVNRDLPSQRVADPLLDPEVVLRRALCPRIGGRERPRPRSGDPPAPRAPPRPAPPSSGPPRIPRTGRRRRKSR